MIDGPPGWILTLAIAYVALGALTLWSLLATRLPWLMKAMMIVALSGFYVAGFFGLRALPGYDKFARICEEHGAVLGEAVMRITAMVAFILVGATCFSITFQACGPWIWKR